MTSLPLLLGFSLSWNELILLVGGAIVLFDGAVRKKVVGGRILGIAAVLHIVASIAVQQMEADSAARGLLKPLSALIMPLAVVWYFRKQRSLLEVEVAEPARGRSSGAHPRAPRREATQ